MKIIFLNTWGGRVFEPLMKFVEESAASTDFFCFQEIVDAPNSFVTNFGGRSDILRKLTEALPKFNMYHQVSHNALNKDLKTEPTVTVGTAIFAKKEITIQSEGRVHVQGDPSGSQHDDKLGAPHDLQYLRFEYGGKSYTLCNMHGTAHPGSKLDTPERIEQSRRIVDFLAKETGEKILGGDFNLFPETESIKVIENAGMRNLIKEYDIQTTRSELNDERYPENKRQYFSDYVFVSPGINVTKFEVPQLNISDHLPLILTFE